jgi:hypothetical protein
MKSSCDEIRAVTNERAEAKESSEICAVTSTTVTHGSIERDPFEDDEVILVCHCYHGIGRVACQEALLHDVTIRGTVYHGITQCRWMRLQPPPPILLRHMSRLLQ